MNTPSGAEHLDDAVDDGMHVLDMGKTVRRGDQLGGPMRGQHFARGVLAEITLDGRDAARVGDVADVGRLDAENAVAGFLEVRNQRAVIRADIDHQILFGQAQHRRAFALQFGEIVAQQFGGAEV